MKRVVAIVAAVAAVIWVAACASASTQTVTQSASTPTPTVTQTVTQQAAPTPTAAPATAAPSGGGSGGGVSQTVPSDLIGARLDVAESELDGSGITYNEVGGGTFGIIVKSNWIVCQTRPTAGQQVPNSGVDLIVNHFSCSGG